MTGKHFARDLRVAGLVGAYQSEISQTKKKQKTAKTGEQQPIQTRAQG